MKHAIITKINNSRNKKDIKTSCSLAHTIWAFKPMSNLFWNIRQNGVESELNLNLFSIIAQLLKLSITLNDPINF